MNRNNWSAIALILLISHAALSLHVTSHVPTDQAPCEFCTGQANPSHAIPVAATAMLPPATYKVTTDHPMLVRKTAGFIPYQQRAPPAVS